MSAGSGKLVATDEATIVTESLLEAIMMKGGQSDGGLADTASANESDGRQVFRQTDDLLYQFLTSKTDPWRRGR